MTKFEVELHSRTHDENREVTELRIKTVVDAPTLQAAKQAALDHAREVLAAWAFRRYFHDVTRWRADATPALEKPRH
jgi:hypothetical protein